MKLAVGRLHGAGRAAVSSHDPGLTQSDWGVQWSLRGAGGDDRKVEFWCFKGLQFNPLFNSWVRYVVTGGGAVRTCRFEAVYSNEGEFTSLNQMRTFETWWNCSTQMKIAREGSRESECNRKHPQKGLMVKSNAAKDFSSVLNHRLRNVEKIVKCHIFYLL